MLFRRKQKNEKAFSCCKETAQWTLENEDGLLSEVSEAILLEQLEFVYDHANEFLILTAPKEIHGLRYMQITMLENEDINLQVGIEKQNACYLYEKQMDEYECSDIFLNFFVHAKLPDLTDFQPVEFLS